MWREVISMFYLFLLDHFCYLGGACFKETPDFVFHKLFVGELEFYLPRFYCFSKCIPFGVLGLGGQRVYCFAFESFPLCVCVFFSGSSSGETNFCILWLCLHFGKYWVTGTIVRLFARHSLCGDGVKSCLSTTCKLGVGWGAVSSIGWAISAFMATLFWRQGYLTWRHWIWVPNLH